MVGLLVGVHKAPHAGVPFIFLGIDFLYLQEQKTVDVSVVLLDLHLSQEMS